MKEIINMFNQYLEVDEKKLNDPIILCLLSINKQIFKN